MNECENVEGRRSWGGKKMQSNLSSFKHVRHPYVNDE